MILNEQGLSNRNQWEEKGYHLPQFSRPEITANTKTNPTWIHFGAGNIFRAFQANVVQNLLNQGIIDTGLIVAEGFDYEIIEKINKTHDDYTLLATLKSDGTVAKTVVGSIVESLTLDSDNREDFIRLEEIFTKDSLQMASFTITEKGYSLVDGHGNRSAIIEQDFQNGPVAPASYLGKVTALLYTRYLAGQKPIAMVSMDNLSHNGDVFKASVLAYAKAWTEQDLAEADFLAYVQDENKVSFPWSMIDKITPRPDASVQKMLEEDGVTGMEPVITTKNTYVAPFVNAEETEYLVVQDSFPNGRQAWDQGGIIFTTQETVDKVEKMKVCTCLNPLHTTLAIFGCLLDYNFLSEEMKNPALKKLVEGVGYTEGLPVVVNPGIIDPKAFIDTAINVRIPNPFMPDTPQRIATDTSQKLAIRFGETIKAYAVADDLAVASLTRIPLVLAGWLRYLMAIDDQGNAFDLSPDPLLAKLTPVMSKISLGFDGDVEPIIKPILEDTAIFGVNLYEVGLAPLVISYFEEMIQEPGAIQKLIEKVVA